MQHHSEKPLPPQFYDARAWLRSLITHYTETHQLLSASALRLPLASLSRAIENVINIYGNFPDTTCQFFRQTINPLFESSEYYDDVYLKLKEAAEEESKPNFFILAESLLFIRRLFEKDSQFLLSQFSNEFELVEGHNEKDRLDKFAAILHTITKVHVNQVVKMIKSYNYSAPFSD